MRSIKSKIIATLAVLAGLLLLQSYLFNHLQESLTNLQNIQDNAISKSEAVVKLERDVMALQSHAVAFIDKANKNNITKFKTYLEQANIHLEQLTFITLDKTPEYKNMFARLSEHLKNYETTFEKVVVNRQKREQIYLSGFKLPIEELQKQVMALESVSNNDKKILYNDILLTISNLKHAAVSYLYKPNFDEAQNVKQNLEFLHTKINRMSAVNNSLLDKTINLKKTHNQLILLTRSYTYSVNVVLTGIENELLYLSNKIKSAEEEKLKLTKLQFNSELTKKTKQSSLFTLLILIILLLLCYFIFTFVIKPISQLTLLLNSMNEGEPIKLKNKHAKLTEIASVLKAANTLYLKSEETKQLLDETRALNVKMEAMNTELTQAIEETNRANKTKIDFVANMSHELRTPMNGILGMLQLLQTSDMPEKQDQYAKKAFSSAQSLLQVLNNILDFSKLDSDNVKLEKIPFTLDTIVSNVEDLFSINAQQKGLALNCVVHADRHLTLLGDPIQLNQIINNCIGNAIKFTDKGEVSLTIEVIFQKENKVQLRFSISDTGIGMTQAQSDRVFESFAQGDSSTTRKYGGTGLGLTISKQLTKLLGGDIQVKSELGKGSEFLFTLPFTIAEQQLINDSAGQKNPLPAKVDLPKLTDFKALVVDDNKLNQEITSAMLGKFDLNTTIANDGLDAIDKVSAQHFDIVFMDIQMPHMDGLEATKQLRAKGYNMPIIALSAAVEPRDRKAAADAGMDDFLVKPIVFDALYESLDKHLKSRDNLQTINLVKAKQNVDNNETLLVTLLTRFIDGNNDFSEKTDLLINNNDFATLKRTVHTLKGLAGTLGLEKLQKCALETEKAIIEEKSLNIDLLKENLAATLFSIKELLATLNLEKIEPKQHNIEDELVVINEIHSLALASRPIPNDLKRHLEANSYDTEHGLSKLIEAINNFDYPSVISIIETYKADTKH